MWPKRWSLQLDQPIDLLQDCDAVCVVPFDCRHEQGVQTGPPHALLVLSRTLETMTSTPETKRAPRLHVDGAILGFKRGLRNQYNHVSLIKIKGADDKSAAEFYLGKRVAFITKAKDGSFRVNWGKVCRHHGANGVVRCRFRRNLPPQAIGGRVRVMLYPSRV
jgi:large subunit ribosomal protein L35Ae